MKTQAIGAGQVNKGEAIAVTGGTPLGAVLPSAWPASPLRLLLASHILLGFLVAGITGLLIIQLRARAVIDAQRELLGLSQVLAVQTERVFEAVEAVQNGLLERLQSRQVRTRQDFRDLMSPIAAHEDLRSRSLVLPQFYALAVVDADGHMLASSRAWPTPDVRFDVAEALKAETTLISRSTGEGPIEIARRVSAPDGEFLGLILADLTPETFEQLYQAVNTRVGRTISLSRPDGALLARYPHLDAGLPDPSDRLDTLVATQPLAHDPVVVTVTDTISVVLAQWRRQMVFLAAACLAFELALAGVGRFMLLQLRRQRTLNEASTAQIGAQAALALAQERARADQELSSLNARFSAAIGNMSQVLCLCDAADRVVVVNGRLADMLGLPADAVRPGTDLNALLAQVENGSSPQAADIAVIRAGLQRLKQEGRGAGWFAELSDGRTLAINFTPAEDGGSVVTMEDVTEQQRTEANIIHMARHDALTGLPNRVQFYERLCEAALRSQRGMPSALLYLDLDHFKSVNDTLGHPVGDALLRKVTERLRTQVREVDTISRLGGDEFAVIQSTSNPPQDATMLANRLIAALGQPYDIDGHRVISGASIGIVLLPADGHDPDQLLKNADLALYQAKADGRGRYCFFAPEMDAFMQTRRSLEIDLRHALEHNEFEVFYQPLMNLKTRTVSGFEALLRWRSPERGLVPPSDFVPLVEEIGLIIPLGEWILRQACADAATWPNGEKVAINLSAVQFTSPTLVSDVASALEQSGLDPSRVELEITETVMLQDTDAVLSVLHRLRNLGVRIAMDDFGTGYSSLSYLTRFPFDKVKIDRSFIEGLGHGGDAEAIVASIVDLCDGLGMTTIAEGVQTEEQLRLLAAGRCTEVQGYLFSRPRPAAEVEEMCRTLNATGVPVA